MGVGWERGSIYYNEYSHTIYYEFSGYDGISGLVIL